MTKNKLLLVSVLSALTGVGVAAAQPGDGEHRFEKLDTNSDGVVTTAEFEAGLLTRWTNSDADKDGKVTADEFKAQFKQHAQERFTKLDANNDGVLERSEVAKMPDAIFTKIDADKSGTLSQAEMQNAHPKRGPMGMHGDKWLPGDADRDGVVTKAEATAGAQDLAKKLDANGDGKLTKDELAHGHGFGPRGHHCDDQAKPDAG